MTIRNFWAILHRSLNEKTPDELTILADEVHRGSRVSGFPLVCLFNASRLKLSAFGYAFGFFYQGSAVK